MFYKFFIVGERSKLKWRTITLAEVLHRTNDQQRRLVLVRGVTLSENTDCQLLVESAKCNAFQLKQRELFYVQK